ncbi:hypothetical protein A9Q84_09380 [Halobacteriovorax marinus]|uniref:DUF3943 domain-containing protein n=1 Tax=Halobacteriovorax marinus TaxID=97084 RepID=A0A1Y5FCI1_9BACT|nr:hypothetical protein A9Q84_09380 [Halobacteriovorax marinus]
MNLKSIFLSLVLLTSAPMNLLAAEKIEFKPIDYFQTTSTTELEEGQIDPWLMNPVSRFISKEAWNEIQEDMRNEEELKQKQARMFGQGKVITVDTRDQEGCHSLQATLARRGDVPSSELNKLCIKDSKSPYTSIVVVDDQYRMPISLDNLSDKQRKMVEQTRNFTAIGAAAIGLIWMLPESVSKWDKDSIKDAGLIGKWKENVKEGPVVDKDDWVINYIGHPISGAAYYTVARHAGLTRTQSFGYSVFMSTVFWEYGFEAVAETPSIQDLLITPIIGSLMGEALFQMSEKIKENDGELFGSKGFGGFAMAVMNPAGAMLDGINNLFDNDIMKSSRTYLFTQPASAGSNDQHRENDSGFIGIGIEFKF